MLSGDWVKVSAIFSLTAIELYALHIGIDHMLFGLTVAAIAGLGGYSFGMVKKKQLQADETNA